MSDKRPKENWISVENKTDGFSMSIQDTPPGDFSLGATSPCVWPNGTPAQARLSELEVWCVSEAQRASDTFMPSIWMVIQTLKQNSTG